MPHLLVVRGLAARCRPNKHLLVYKHGSMATCSQDAAKRAPGCKPTALAIANTKGVLVHSWKVMIPPNIDWSSGSIQTACPIKGAKDTCDAEPTLELPTLKSDLTYPGWEPYYGSLTGVARTGPNGYLYACGRPQPRESMPVPGWFLFRFAYLDEQKEDAYVEQVIPMTWLGPVRRMASISGLYPVQRAQPALLLC